MNDRFGQHQSISPIQSISTAPHCRRAQANQPRSGLIAQSATVHRSTYFSPPPRSGPKQLPRRPSLSLSVSPDGSWDLNSWSYNSIIIYLFVPSCPTSSDHCSDFPSCVFTPRANRVLRLSSVPQRPWRRPRLDKELRSLLARNTSMPPVPADS